MLDRPITFDELADKVMAAFSDVPYPGDNNIIGDCLEFEYGKDPSRVLRGVNWRDLEKVSFVAETKTYALPYPGHLTPSAYHFYLPGYMLVLARHYRNATVWTYSIVSSLLLYSEGDTLAIFEKEHLKRFEMLNLTQKRVVRLFLEYLEQEYHDDIQFDDPAWTPRAALEQYWKKF
jgi:hypothetical protein